jgi:F-box/WD-40 domain protein MET30
VNEGCNEIGDSGTLSNAENNVSAEESDQHSAPRAASIGPHVASPPLRRGKTMLVSGSLDNTIKIWDIETVEVQKTLFGHIEGVWCVAGDEWRLVSGSHDRTVKVEFFSSALSSV